MRAILCFGGAYVVCVSVCALVMTASPAKTAEPITMPLGVLSCVGLRYRVLDGGAYGRHLANTIEHYVLGGDAGCRYHNCINVQSRA